MNEYTLIKNGRKIQVRTTLSKKVAEMAVEYDTNLIDKIKDICPEDYFFLYKDPDEAKLWMVYQKSLFSPNLGLYNAKVFL